MYSLNEVKDFLGYVNLDVVTVSYKGKEGKASKWIERMLYLLHPRKHKFCEYLYVMANKKVDV